MKILPPEHMKAYLEAAERRGLLPMFYLELVSGLRKGELVALRWDDLDIQQRTISVSKQYVRNPDGSLELTRPKTENSVRLVSIPQTAVDLLVQEHAKHPDSPYPVPLTPHRRDVPPGQRGESSQEDPKRCRIGASQVPRSPAHLRHHRPSKRGRRENRVLHAGTLRRPGSPCAPTPTPPGRSRTKRQPLWEISWNRSCKAERKAGQEVHLPVRRSCFR